MIGAMTGTSKPQVLAVDDSPSVLDSLKIILAKEGSMQLVGTAQEAESALRQTRRLRPDLILMDLRMPGKSGIEATREIRQMAPKVKILILSGHPGGQKTRFQSVLTVLSLKGDLWNG
jgi:DNA-binding NarL/FixJ family response regulator